MSKSRRFEVLFMGRLRKEEGSMNFSWGYALKIQEIYVHKLWIHQTWRETFELWYRPTSCSTMVCWLFRFFPAKFACVFAWEAYRVKGVEDAEGVWGSEAHCFIVHLSLCLLRRRNGTSEDYALDLVWLVA